VSYRGIGGQDREIVDYLEPVLLLLLDGHTLISLERPWPTQRSIILLKSVDAVTQQIVYFEPQRGAPRPLSLMDLARMSVTLKAESARSVPTRSGLYSDLSR
jgi:hypothetical protein